MKKGQKFKKSIMIVLAFLTVGICYSVEAPELRDKIQTKNLPATYLSDSPKTVYEKGHVLKSGDTVKSSKAYWDAKGKKYPVLAVTPKGNGFEIKTSHSTAWHYVTIHVYNNSQKIENASIITKVEDNKKEGVQTYFYPFVKAGEEYKIYITKYDKGYSNYASFEYDSVKVTAIGGLGNFNIKSDGFIYNKNNGSLIIKGLTFTMPASVKQKGTIKGSIYDGGKNAGKSITAESILLEDSKINLEKIKYLDSKTNKSESAKEFITGKKYIYTDFKFNYSYFNKAYNSTFEYECKLIKDIIYDKSKDVGYSKTLVLKGGTELPKVYITCDKAKEYRNSFRLGDGWKKATIKIKGGSFNLTETKVEIKERGNSTKGTGKTPFSLKFKKDVGICGMKKSSRWVLMANYFDRSLIRTEFAGYLGQRVFNSTWNASFTPVNVYFNGKFIGTYDIGESNRIEKNRINIQSLKDFADSKKNYKDVNKDKVVDINDAGFMLEIDTFNETAERLYFYSNQYLVPFTLKDPDFSSTSKYPWATAKTYRDYARGKINAFETMLIKKDFGENYKKYIDVDSFIDWYLMNEFSKNSDAIFQKSVCVYYNAANGKIYMGPNWDYDLAFGNLSEANCDKAAGWYIYGGKKWCMENQYLSQQRGDGTGYNVKAYWINRLFELPEFKAAVKKRWNKQKGLLKDAINGKIVEFANRVYNSIPENEKNLPRIGVSEWNGPTGYETRTEYEDEVYYMYLWCMERYNWMDEQISSW